MSRKREILDALTRERLLGFARSVDLSGLTNKSKAEIVDGLASSKRARLHEFLPELSRDELKAICAATGLDDSGREKQLLVDRLLGKESEDDDEPPAPPPGSIRPPPTFPPPPTPQLANPPKRRTTRDPSDPAADYRHDGAKRKNIPPAKLAAEGTVPALPKIEYSYSPRRPPELRFDATCRQQGRGLLTYLVECCQAQLKVKAPPSLLPKRDSRVEAA